jgi:hypothetical protein
MEDSDSLRDSDSCHDSDSFHGLLPRTPSMLHPQRSPCALLAPTPAAASLAWPRARRVTAPSGLRQTSFQSCSSTCQWGLSTANGCINCVSTPFAAPVVPINTPSAAPDVVPVVQLHLHGRGVGVGGVAWGSLHGRGRGAQVMDPPPGDAALLHGRGGVVGGGGYAASLLPCHGLGAREEQKHTQEEPSWVRNTHIGGALPGQGRVRWSCRSTRPSYQRSSGMARPTKPCSCAAPRSSAEVPARLDARLGPAAGLGPGARARRRHRPRARVAPAERARPSGSRPGQAAARRLRPCMLSKGGGRLGLRRRAGVARMGSIQSCSSTAGARE